MNKVAEQIVTGAYQCIETWKATPPPDPYSHEDRWKLYQRSQAIEHARDDLVRCDAAAWLQRAMTPSAYVAVSRAYIALEKGGFITRHALGCSGTTTTHIKLTAAGRAEAERLLDVQPSELSYSLPLRQGLAGENDVPRTREGLGMRELGMAALPVDPPGEAITGGPVTDG